MLSLVRARPRTVAAIVGVQVTALVVCVALQRPRGPVLFSDEMAYLAGAWNFSTRSGEAVLSASAFYSPGLSAVLAPWLSIVPADAWSIAVAVNLVMAVLLPLAIWLFAVENLDLPPRQGAVIALASGLYPAILIQSTRAWPEVMLALVAVLWAISIGRFLRHRSTASAIAGGLIGGLAYAVHHRMAGVATITALVFSFEAWRTIRDPSTRSRRVSATPPALGVIATVGGFLASLGLDKVLIDTTYAEAPIATEYSMFDAVLPSNIRSTFEHLVGHLWYIQVATLGLATIAVLAVIVRQRRKRSVDVGLVILAGFVSTICISALFLSPYDRVDHVVYGRYTEIWAPLLIAIGLSALAHATPMLRRAVLLNGYLSLLLAGLLVLLLGTEFFRRPPNKMTVPVAMAWDLVAGDWNSDVTFEFDLWTITAATAVLGLGVSVLAMRFRHGAVAAAAVFLTLGVAAAQLSYQPFYNVYEYTGVIEADLIRAGGAGTFGVVDGVSPESLKAVQYHSEYLPLVTVDPSGACPDVRFFLASEDVTLDFEATRLTRIAPFGGALYEATC